MADVVDPVGGTRGSQIVEPPRCQSAWAQQLDDPELRLSVIVPAYCEASRIGSAVALLHEVLHDLVASGGYEVIVVDDGSDDGTADAARAAGANQVLTLDRNRGKGAAVREGVFASKGRTISFIDADMSYDPSQLRRLLAAIEGGSGMAVGNRHHGDSVTLAGAGALRNVSSRIFSSIVKAFLNSSRPDTQCGLKAFDRDVAAVLFGHAQVDRFAFDIELFFLADRFGVAVVDVPVTLSHSPTSSVRLHQDALVMLVDVVRVRLRAVRGKYDRELAN